jgi:site-specific DNA-methyltransferase (adenine-specific)
MKYRLRDMFEILPEQAYQVVGEPKDVSGAQQLAQENRYQFQYWALSLIQAKPVGGEIGGRSGKKGSDRGVDGVINFIEMGGKTQRVIVHGKVKSGDIRDLVGTLEREKAAIGVFITLDHPSRDMLTEAVSAGYFHSQTWNRDYPKLQIITIGELLAGKQVEMPYAWGTFKQAERIAPTADQPQTLDMFKTSP